MNQTSSNEVVSTILDSLDGIIYVSDFETYELLYVNQGLKDLLGFDPTGRKCWQYIHAQHKGACSFCSNSKLLDKNGQPEKKSHCWEYINPYNKKWYSARDQAIRWSDGRYVRLEIAVDITDQKSIQQFLEEAKIQAEAAKDLKNRYVAMVAHDLKSPFVAILGMLQRILEKEEFSKPVHKQFMKEIINNGRRMMSMIDNLLDMDRLEAGRMRPDPSFFDSSKMVDEVFNKFAHMAQEKKITLENRVPLQKGIFADKYLYFTILNNLISNGIKFCHPEGEVSVFVPDGGGDNTLAVRDTGIGVKEEIIPDLFEEDIETTSRGTSGEQGTGLGLIFCKEIVKAHGGTIRIESSEEEGSIFYIDLPEVCDLGNGEKQE